MTIAAITAARHAAGAIALAAVAVSAHALGARGNAKEPIVREMEISLEPRIFHYPNDRRDRSPTRTAKIGTLTVVGTAVYDEVARPLVAAESIFEECASSTTRVTVYAHFRHGRVTEATALGLDEAAAECARKLVAGTEFSVGEEMDLMIPIDLVK